MEFRPSPAHRQPARPKSADQRRDHSRRLREDAVQWRRMAVEVEQQKIDVKTFGKLLLQFFSQRSEEPAGDVWRAAAELVRSETDSAKLVEEIRGMADSLEEEADRLIAEV